MKHSFGKLLVGASMAIGLGAVAATPAQAGTLTGATIGGTAASDYLVYDVSGNNTVLVPSTPANAAAVLTGNAASPTGNIELRKSTEQGTFTANDFTKNTTLSGQIGGQDITLSSLTYADWFSTGSGNSTAYGANNLATTWFNTFLTQANKANYVGTVLGNLAYSAFFNIKGFQRSSDPNISYVNQDDATGLIKIGLAGHYNLKAAYSAPGSPFATFASLLPAGFQASEVVKYTYNGVTDYLYSFNATASGLNSNDNTSSHNGNYEVTIQGDPQAVPEPSVMLGVFGVAGIVAAQRKLKKVSA
ncbi:NF038130 family PEP-CTERM protein [Anabaena cylindrica FACHB-243]|uniref:PEP motif putative anchor domain protein n=1 Tax=Anabaena cylindrica (strain ATCC 27899 / PCC 7122) TaxID=272123 RepID=K9ZE97_ANACC|nr:MULTISPECIES: NF038130 family PEP-CTERM protein [Anabaena]AFZ57059.1 PEP motif putative anchor domain protein [Anabaena cylindrica PCC 7122]MBD2421469.1 NF038130 family PEP-CTERM protein [Anabaena cylindrica FACHB-243]MBY5285759.1 PEP-CTERM sorting domain-containing protein [Anabaena sp. CCAP 1446/1C]MBY5309813.1 PEP-CTERM sorting domain-containing protein [Anabaena sp. CCAP 1446/1C]MCM2407770.1 NF038130 family PEP-CTERM protein [Anabaena sp. CCAP 1446/1C]